MEIHFQGRVSVIGVGGGIGLVFSEFRLMLLFPCRYVTVSRTNKLPVLPCRSISSAQRGDESAVLLFSQGKTPKALHSTFIPGHHKYGPTSPYKDELADTVMMLTLVPAIFPVGSRCEQDFLCGFLRESTQSLLSNARTVPRLGHVRFLPDPFQFIFQQSSKILISL
jgi:hypothetical protein